MVLAMGREGGGRGAGGGGIQSRFVMNGYVLRRFLHGQQIRVGDKNPQSS